MSIDLPHHLNPQDLRTFLDRGERFQLIDVRTIREFEECHLPGAVHIPLEQVESRLADLHPADPVVLICQSGRRAEICRGMVEGHRNDLIVLEGGTRAWEAAGLAVIRSTANRLPLMRQVQAIAGLLILTGTVLGRFYSPNWIFLAMFVGGGLTVAGFTGFCGMANLLALMPWNRSTCPAQTTR